MLEKEKSLLQRGGVPNEVVPVRMLPKMPNKKSKKSSEEAKLSSLLFGGGEVSSSSRASDSKKVEAKGKKQPKKSSEKDSDSDNDSEGSIEVDFEVDRGSKASAKKQPAGAKKRKNAAAWADEDDDDLEVDLSSKNQLKKLQKPDENGKIKRKDRKVTGTELSDLLKERFNSSQQLDWASIPASEDKEDAASKLLKKTGTMVVSARGKKGGRVPEGRLDISRLVDGNAADASKSSISSVAFHHEGSTLMVASQDRSLKFFRVDGDRNEKVSSMRFADMHISCAAFVGRSNDVVVGGRKPYFYNYDGATGQVAKIPGLMGKGLKSHESFAVSPEGTKIAFLGAGGYTHIVDGRNKAWQMDVKCNTAVRAAVFASETSLFTSGLDADVYQWDLRMNARCLSRFRHEDGTCTASLAVSASGSYLAVGAESGVVTVYDGTTLPATRGDSSSNGNNGLATPKPVKSALNLTTKVGTVCFHPSSQLMAYASAEVNDQLRMMHLPSASIFTNWPTERTPLRKVQCLAFSPQGAYMAAGNDRGRVLLYRLNHFQSS
jgi:U3 small nucleolar RNA-associated protein 18